MSVVSKEEMRLGQITIRFLLEGEAAGGSVAMFECDVPAGARVPVPHSHDGYEETIYGLRRQLMEEPDQREYLMGDPPSSGVAYDLLSDLTRQYRLIDASSALIVARFAHIEIGHDTDDLIPRLGGRFAG